MIKTLPLLAATAALIAGNAIAEEQNYHEADPRNTSLRGGILSDLESGEFA